jgi:solute:Na+ symporter, SSS family
MPRLNGTNWIDYGVIGLYFAVIICAGLLSARRSRTTEDYFTGDGKVPWPLAGLSIWAAGFSAFVFVGVAGFVYNNGVGAMLVNTLPMACTYVLTALIFARMWRRSRITTPMEFLTRRYSPSTTYFYSVANILPAAAVIGQGLYIVCLFVSSVLGFADQRVAFAGLTLSGFQIAVVVVGAVMVFYTAVGGLWGAVLTSTVQSVIMVVMSVVVFFVTFVYLGRGAGFVAGFQHLLHAAPPNFFSLQGGSVNPIFWVAFGISEFLNYSVSWPIIQRLQSVDDERSARKLTLLCAVLALMAPLLWFLPVMAARVIFPDIHALWPALAVPEEASYASLALLLLPHGMLGIVVAAIFSAALGAANGIFNWVTATVAHDVYAPLRRLAGHEPTDRQQMRVVHVTMVVLGVFAVVIALYIPRLGGAFNFMLKYLSLGMVFSVPVVLGLVYRRTPWWSAIAAISAALAVGITLMVLGLWENQALARNILSETGVAAAVFVISARWYRDDDPLSAGARRLTEDLNRPVVGAGTVADPAGSVRVYGWVGAISAVFALALLVCAFLPSGGQTSPWINVAASLGLVVIGACLWRVSKRSG